MTITKFEMAIAKSRLRPEFKTATKFKTILKGKLDMVGCNYCIYSIIMTIWHCVIIVYASTPVGAWERRMQHEFCKCRKDMEGGRFWPHSENKHGMLCLKRYHNFFSASSILLEQPVQITVKIDIVSEKTKAFCFTHLSLTSDHTTWIWVSWAKFRNFDFTLRLIPSNWPMFSKWKRKKNQTNRKKTRPSRPIRFDVLIVERMRYPTDRPTNRPTDLRSGL